MDEDRWKAAIDNAYEWLDIYKKTPNGFFGATMIAVDIARYENGERSEELLTELEGIN